MACPNCGCKVCYTYDEGWDGDPCGDEALERCAACGHIFDISDATPEDDDIFCENCGLEYSACTCCHSGDGSK